MEEKEATQEGPVADPPDTGADEVASEKAEPDEESGGVVKEGE
jgi:hypothetical protein